MKKISIENNFYPETLRQIKNPPSSIYVEGNISLLKNKSIAIIGSRNCSENGIKIAQKFSSELSSVGLTIISGLAKGIDSVAHEFSLDKSGKTIAVLGSGFNNIFPESNLELYHKILEKDGLIISEYSPTEIANSKNFLQRNRIISALSLGVLIVEAFSRSGTSNTAKYAREQNKPVFVVPHEIWDSRGVGTNRLIKNGAKLVTNSADILKFLKLIPEKKAYLKLKSSQNNCSKENITQYKEIPSFEDSKQELIFNILCNSSSKKVSVNDLANKSGFEIKDILSILFLLELNGYIKKTEGGYKCI